MAHHNRCSVHLALLASVLIVPATLAAPPPPSPSPETCDLSVTLFKIARFGTVEHSLEPEVRPHDQSKIRIQVRNEGPGAAESTKMSVTMRGGLPFERSITVPALAAGAEWLREELLDLPTPLQTGAPAPMTDRMELKVTIRATPPGAETELSNNSQVLPIRYRP